MAKTAENVANVPVQKLKLTAERAIAEIRSLRAGGLFVGNMEYVDLLLAEYDAEKLIRKEYETSLAIHAGFAETENSVPDEPQESRAYEGLTPEPSIVQEGVPS